MDKKELKKKRSEKIVQLKSLCEDKKFADSLIADIVSLTGQITTDPMAIYVREEDVINSMESDTFRIFTTPTKAAFVNKGGYAVVSDIKYTSLYILLNMFASEHEKMDADPDEENRKNYKAMISALSYCMQIPLYGSVDMDFLMKIAIECIHFISDRIKAASEAELQPEDHDLNGAFKDVVESILNDNYTSANESNKVTDSE